VLGRRIWGVTPICDWPVQTADGTEITSIRNSGINPEGFCP
jgi:hypothetical protein